MLGLLYVTFMTISIICSPIFAAIWLELFLRRRVELQKMSTPELRCRVRDDIYAMVVAALFFESSAQAIITGMRMYFSMTFAFGPVAVPDTTSIMFVVGRGLLALGHIVLFRAIVLGRGKRNRRVDRKSREIISMMAGPDGHGADKDGRNVGGTYV